MAMVIWYVVCPRLCLSVLLFCLQCVISVAMVIPSDIFTLIDFFSFSAWIFYGLTMVALLIMRWKEPNLERPFKVNDVGCSVVITDNLCNMKI